MLSEAAGATKRSGRAVVLEMASTRLVVVDGDLVGDRIALAGEHEAARHFVVLEREIDVHVDLTRDEPGAAGRADAALARIRQLEARGEPRLEDALLRF